MALEYEICIENLKALAEYYSENKDTRNEATTRLQLIDRLFIECLGWSRDDITAEESQGKEYADYTFRAPRRILIVEAKKEGDYFELPVGLNRIEYSLGSLMRDYPNLKDAIEQASGYCQSRGVPYGAICNGHQLAAFIAVRDDGTSPFDGQAVVFTSLEQMLEEFLDFWNLFSKPAIENKNLTRKLLGDILPELPPKLSASIYRYPGIKQRNIFQTDLQIVSELVIEDITRTGDLEKPFLEECYCPSGALSQHSMISKSILKARYDALFYNEPGAPLTIPTTSKDGITPELYAESLSRRPIVLLGDVGVGKTTFIKYLIHVDAVEQFQNAISFYIDLGSQAAINTDIKEFIPLEIARQLLDIYGVDIEERNTVRGIYNLELERFRKSIYSDLYDVNPQLFKEREVEFLAEKVKNRAEHLRSSVEFFSKGWKKQIIVFLDNADQRSDEIQQEVFLISQEISAQWPATVFLALRPETFQRSLKEGALSGYHQKAFTISPPRIDRVLTKRLEFAKKLTSGEIPLTSLSESIRVNFINLNTVIQIFLRTIERRDEIIEFIDNISKGNVRLALDLVREFFGSGHVDTKKFIEIYTETGDYIIPMHEFLRAVIYDDAEYYEPSRTNVTNIFDVSSHDPKEHFLMPILINLLESSKGSSVGEGYVETASVYEKLQSIGFTPTQIDHVMVRAQRRELIESFERSLPILGNEIPEAIRPTSVGMYHIRKLCKLFTYIDAILVDTPIFDNEVREKVTDVQSILLRLERATLFIDYLSSIWLQEEGISSFFDWDGTCHELKADIAAIRVRVNRDIERQA